MVLTLGTDKVIPLFDLSERHGSGASSKECRNLLNEDFSQQGLLSTSTRLTLTAANGLDIPYVSYFEADVE